MLEIRAKKEELAAVSEVAANVRLQSVYLVSLRAENRVEGSPLRLEGGVAQVTPTFEGYKLIKPNSIVTKIKATLSVTSKETGDRSEPWIAIEVTLAGVYDLPVAPMPQTITPEKLETFARLNGLYNCWPYLRAEINRIAGSMNVPLVLPTLRIVLAPLTVGEEKVKDDGSGTGPATRRSSRRRKPGAKKKGSGD